MRLVWGAAALSGVLAGCAGIDARTHVNESDDTGFRYY
jgi:hypothetical protein